MFPFYRIMTRLVKEIFYWVWTLETNTLLLNTLHYAQVPMIQDNILVHLTLRHFTIVHYHIRVYAFTYTVTLTHTLWSHHTYTK